MAQVCPRQDGAFLEEGGRRTEQMLAAARGREAGPGSSWARGAAPPRGRGVKDDQ